MKIITSICVVFVCFVCFASAQSCNPPSGPPCLIQDASSGSTIADLIDPVFWNSLATTAGLPSSTPRIIDVTPGPGGEVAANLGTCGFVYIAVGRNAGFSFSAADIATLRAFYESGGVITMLAENSGFMPYAPTILNPIIPQIDNTIVPPVLYSDPPVFVSPTCVASIPTAAGQTHPFLTTPNDFTTIWYNAASTSVAIPVTDSACLVAAADDPDACIVAIAGTFVYFGDVNQLGLSGFVPCVDLTFISNLGQNFGNLVATCGGSGGDPHLFTFDGKEYDLKFADGKNYLLYDRPELRVVIQTSESYIRRIGVTFKSHQLLATIIDGKPAFLLDGEAPENGLLTEFGILEIFVPDVTFHPGRAPISRGALAELLRYQTIGLKVGSVFEVVGGIHPQTGVFFNVEVREFHFRETGLLKAFSENSHQGFVRDSDFLANFEVAALF